MSRHDARSRRLRRRPSRVVPAGIAALVLLAAGALGAVAAIARLVTGAWSPDVTRPAGVVAGLTWGSPWVVAAGVVVVVLGIVLLVAGLTPGSLRTVELAAPDPGPAVERTEYVISTRALARLAVACADTVDGVDKVSASASGRRIRARVTTTSEQVDQIRGRVERAVAQGLADAGVRPAPRVSAAVRTKEI